MQFKLTALLDKDTQKELKDHILGFAKGIARNEIELTIRDEVNRVGAALRTQLADTSNNYRLRAIILECVTQVLTGSWTNIGQEMSVILEKLLETKLKDFVQTQVEKAAKANIADKLRKKTVWEAESQDEYVRKVVRAELRLLLKP